MITTISKAIASWIIWRNARTTARRLRRALPQIVQRRDNVIPALRKQHKPVKTVIEQNRRELHAVFGLEVR